MNCFSVATKPCSSAVFQSGCTYWCEDHIDPPTLTVMRLDWIPDLLSYVKSKICDHFSGRRRCSHIWFGYHYALPTKLNFCYIADLLNWIISPFQIKKCLKHLMCQMFVSKASYLCREESRIQCPEVCFFSSNLRNSFLLFLLIKVRGHLENHDLQAEIIV